MNELILNIDKIHTTELSSTRISKNLNIPKEEVLDYCKKIITEEKTDAKKRGKNWYCSNNETTIVINSTTYTIITAQKKYNDFKF